MSGTRPRGPAGSRRRRWLPPSTPPGSWVPGGAEQGERGPHLHQRAARREDAARAREPPHEQQREHGERGDLDVVAGQRDVEQERQPGHPQPGACRAAPRPGAGPGEGERDQGVRGEGERDEGLEVGEAGDQAGRQEDGARARRVLPHRVAGREGTAGEGDVPVGVQRVHLVCDASDAERGAPVRGEQGEHRGTGGQPGEGKRRPGEGAGVDPGRVDGRCGGGWLSVERHLCERTSVWPQM